MKAFQRDFFREIGRNKGRFFSVMFIVMLGAAFFSGIRSTKNDMHVSADSYYDRVNFMDIRVVSTLGLTEDDLEDMRNTEGVAAVTGGYTAEVLNEQSDMEFALKVIAWTEDVNQVTLTDGRLPEKANECLADDIYLQHTGCEIGDQITLESGSSEDLSDTLKEETYTIVGSGTLPYYMEMDRGSGTVGDGSLDAFLVVLPEVFEQQDVYTEAYVQAEGAEAENSFDGAYETKVAEVVAGLEEIADGACDRRYETIYQDGMEEIEDAKQEVADAEQELADAKAQIDDGEQQITDAKETLADGEKELEDGESELASREQQLAEARELLESKEAELNSGKSQLADGEQQIADAEAVLSAKEKELADGKAQLEAEAQQLEAGKAEIEEQSESLESGKAQVEEKARELEEAKAQVEAKAQELENGRVQLEAGRAELESGKAELEQNRQTVTAARQELEAKRADYETAKTALQQIEAQLGELQQQLTQTEEQIRQMEEALADAGLDTSPEYEALLAVKTQLETTIAGLQTQKETVQAGITEFEAGEKSVQDGEAQLAAAEQQIAQSEQQLNATEEVLKEGEVQLEAARQQITDSEAQLEASRQQLAAAETQLNAYRQQMADGEAQLNAARQQITDGETQLSQGRQELEQQKSVLEQSKAQMESGEQQIAQTRQQLTEGEAQIAEARQTLADARAELEDGKAELAEKEQELADAKQEYEDGYAEAQPELADARQQIADGEQELKDLEKPEWYVMDREDVTSAKGFADDAERIDNIGQVFPWIFFLVAALISLTTMTRMVEEQRQQIGTLKALGYRDGAIAVKYLCYAMLATVTGAVIGVVIGEKLFPWVIMNAYGMLYLGLPEYLTPLNWEQGLLAILTSIACTGLATLFSCWREMRAKPSELMRPEPPKNGRRVLLERVTILWKHLSFTQKSTVRNLFRYKKRFFMTVIGIGGCMGLMLVGFGLQDSITAIAKNQFVELFTYQAAVVVNSESKEQKDALREQAEMFDGMGSTLEMFAQNVELTAGDESMSAIMEVPQDPSVVDQFFTFRDRRSKESYEFPEDGIAISEKTAKMLGVSVGDTIKVGEENKEGREVTISIIIENYVEHYIFMAPSLYESVWQETPDYNQILMKYEDTSDRYEENLGQMMIEQDGVVGVTFVSDLEAEIDDMLQALNIVIVVLIVSAGLLAFVVLYNLNNINITERKRELATLKVLGFYDMEVAEYVYRENVILTILGILAGAGIGLALHQYIIHTVEVDMMMFGRTVFPRSYLFSGLLTLVFSLFVNYMMYYRLKKIDMIESLKSVE
ncbi:MAG: FtsX-like permease family protein [Lachnospiraceae bacterium]|nr:FtsX-like permease family protein [Lachnospiraceae bacterium]